MKGITVGLRVDLRTPDVYPSAPCSDQSKRSVLLAPNLAHTATVRSSLKAFVRINLLIPDEEQLLVAPLFTRLSDGLGVEEIYRRYACAADRDECDLFVDEESLIFFGREKGRTVNLCDESRLDEYNIVDKCVVEVKKAPQALAAKGGRLFVETREGILSLKGISGLTRVSDLKEAIEKYTGIHRSQQLLSSVGRVMHDEFLIRDFDGDGLHAIYQDSIVDLTVSGDKNKEQSHRRMLITINVAGYEEFSLVVQGRDLVEGIARVVEARTGIPQWQQRISLSGKSLDSKKTLADYFVSPDCVLQVSVFKSPLKSSSSFRSSVDSSADKGGESNGTPAARKLKLVRTCKGILSGTMVIPVLTSDTVGDLRRKVKRSLRPLEERNVSTPTPPARPKTSRRASPHAAAAYKLPPPPLDSAGTPYHTPPQTPKTTTPRSSSSSPLVTRSFKNATRRLFNDRDENNADEKMIHRNGMGAWLKQILH